MELKLTNRTPGPDFGHVLATFTEYSLIHVWERAKQQYPFVWRDDNGNIFVSYIDPKRPLNEVIFLISGESSKKGYRDIEELKELVDEDNDRRAALSSDPNTRIDLEVILNHSNRRISLYIATYKKGVLSRRVACFREEEASTSLKCTLLYWRIAGEVDRLNNIDNIEH